MLRLCVAAATLILVACQSSPPLSLQPDTKPKSATKNSTAVDAPEVQCQGELPDSLQSTFPGYRLAKPADFVEPIQKLDQQPQSSDYTSLYGNSPATCSIFTADFNQDGQRDYAVLLINQTTNYSQFRLLLNRGTAFETVRLTDYEKPPEPIKGLVYTAMFLKPTGELGAAARRYFPIKADELEWRQFVSSPTVELWNPPIVTPTAFPEQLRPEYFRFEQLGSSSALFYFTNGELKSLNL